MYLPAPRKPDAPLLKNLGWEFVQWADGQLLWGVLGLTRGLWAQISQSGAQRRAAELLDWTGAGLAEVYEHQDGLLAVERDDGKILVLPQVVMASGPELPIEESVRVELLEEDFACPDGVEEALAWRKRIAHGGKVSLYDGVNARLRDVVWDEGGLLLRFQGVRYFDYVKTNLALDAPRGTLPPLREWTARDGRIEPLSASRLANATGINGLVFSKDGYCIFQRRNSSVLVRPGELCSGFSGTVDRDDIQQVVAAGGALSHLKAVREGVEELGIDPRDVTRRVFLGITRELVRGGTPELFWAVDVDRTADEILALSPRDREGERHKAQFGSLGAALPVPGETDLLARHFWALVNQLGGNAKSPVSTPLLTNLLLWLQRTCPDQVKTISLPSGQ